VPLAPTGHVVVTGAAGFIGTALVRALLEAGHRVTAVDHVACSLGGETVIGDLRDERTRDRAVEHGVSSIFHLAAATSVVGSLQDPLGVFHDNVTVTAEMLELARARGVRRFLMSSTNAVVGEVGETIIHEGIPPRPLTPYGATKAAAEMLLCAYAGSYGMSTCAVRLTNVYGPGMGHKDSFVARLMRAARDGSGITVFGHGHQRRDFVHVSDVVSGLMLAEHSSVEGSLIIGSGTSVTMNELIERVRRVTGQGIEVEHVQARPGEMSAVIVDVTRARSIGYGPAVELDAGLATVWNEAAAGWTH
jgi:UDP-glucose 4-epimerase